MESQAIIGFLIVAVTLTVTPGPDWAYSIAAGLGRRSYAPAIAGLCSGYILHTILLAAGIAALMAAVPALLLWLTVTGAAYLLWLGWCTLRSWRAAGFANGVTAAVEETDDGGTRLGAYARGFGVSAINPKGMLLFLALTPQFISTRAVFPVPVQSAILGLSFVASAAIIYTIVAAGSRRLLRSRPGGARVVTLASGIIMCVLGVALLAEQVRPVLAFLG
ncbi:LysE family translocator [Specibacter cremeus]|uniref:LysE family translocator n=1 Tax=Specibacter cremeus TaxID=1629051 RepID=UPI000F76FC55|nr:LysE family translocator [Specibacter cremeus]